MMLFIDAADAAQALHRRLVVETRDQRVAGIGRQRDDAAGLDDLRGLPEQPQLGIFRMYLKELSHRMKKAEALCRRLQLLGKMRTALSACRAARRCAARSAGGSKTGQGNPACHGCRASPPT